MKPLKTIRDKHSRWRIVLLFEPRDIWFGLYIKGKTKCFRMSREPNYCWYGADDPTHVPQYNEGTGTCYEFYLGIPLLVIYFAVVIADR